MSAKDRAAREMKERDDRLTRNAMMGLADALDTKNGQAWLWYFYANNCNSEDEREGPGRRAVARDLLAAAKVASWAGVQAMREEWERPTLKLALAQEQEEEADE